MIDAIRYFVGRKLYYWGFRILPARLREPISTINAIGMHWVNNDCPDDFSISLTRPQPLHDGRGPVEN